MKTDTELLDWLEKERPNVMCLCMWNGSTECPEDLNLKPDGFLWEVNNKYHGPTLRQAIAKAMENEATDSTSPPPPPRSE